MDRCAGSRGQHSHVGMGRHQDRVGGSWFGTQLVFPPVPLTSLGGDWKLMGALLVILNPNRFFSYWLLQRR